MKLKQLQRNFRDVTWPKDSNDLPILTWEEFQDQHRDSGRKLIVVGGFIHDVSEFINEHPGGYGLIKSRLGRDATNAFHGGQSHPLLFLVKDCRLMVVIAGVYDHSNAAHNALAGLRVGVIQGGYEVEHLKKRVGVWNEERLIPVCGPKKAVDSEPAPTKGDATTMTATTEAQAVPAAA